MDMENASGNQLTRDISDGQKKRKPAIPLKKLVTEALLSAPSTGMVVAEIYEYVSSRCKDYDTKENKWKINVRNMLTTTVYFQCFPRRERDGRRGKAWKFNQEAYDCHLKVKGNPGEQTIVQSQDINQNSATPNIVNVASFPSRATTSHSAMSAQQGQNRPSHEVTSAMPSQPLTSPWPSMDSCHPWHSIKLLPSQQSFGRGYNYPPPSNSVHPNANQDTFMPSYSNTVRRSSAYRFAPYRVHDIRNNFMHSAYTSATHGLFRGNATELNQTPLQFYAHPHLTTNVQHAPLQYRSTTFDDEYVFGLKDVFLKQASEGHSSAVSYGASEDYLPSTTAYATNGHTRSNGTYTNLDRYSSLSGISSHASSSVCASIDEDDLRALEGFVSTLK